MPEVEIDLWGNIIPPKLKWKRPKPSGYFAPPGTGPADQNCKTCVHSVLFVDRHFKERRHYKCGMNKNNWTDSYRTNVQAKSPACSSWLATPPKSNQTQPLTAICPPNHTTPP